MYLYGQQVEVFWLSLFCFSGMDFYINWLCNYSFPIVLIIRIPFVTKVSSVSIGMNMIHGVQNMHVG